MLSRGSKKAYLSPREIPSGSCVITAGGERFYISGQTRLRIPSERVYKSWSFPIVLRVEEAAVKNYPIVGSVGFRDGTFIKNIMDARMYIISKSRARQVASPDVLTNLNLQEKDAILVSEQELNLHKLGEPLT